MRYIFILLFLSLGLSALAQQNIVESLQRNRAGEGTVGNNSRVARNEANNVATKVKEEFPDMPVYAYFQPPRWLCRVGDFRSIEEADAAMRRLKATGVFKEVSIVREQINIPLD